VPVLAPGTGKTATGYLWAFRTGPFSDRQAVVFRFSPDRNQSTATQALRSFRGILQVDGYAGYNEVLRGEGVIEAGCFAHARRKYFDLWQATKSPAAQLALTQIGKLYDIERDCREASIAERLDQRQTRAGPILAEFKAWLESTYAKSPPRSALAKAIQYNLNRWKALVRYLGDGRINIDTNPVENCIRGIAVPRSSIRSSRAASSTTSNPTPTSSISSPGCQPPGPATSILCCPGTIGRRIVQPIRFARGKAMPIKP
jgi:transposase